MEMVLDMRFSEYKIPAVELSAKPRGPRLFAGSMFEPDPLGGATSTKPNTFPLVSTLATRSVPKAATYMKFPRGSKTTPVGCASAIARSAAVGGRTAIGDSRIQIDGRDSAGRHLNVCDLVIHPVPAQVRLERWSS